VGLFWQNEKRFKSNKIDETSKKEKKEKVQDTKNRVEGGE